jgi:arylsulfatase A-like enzyme
MGAPLGARTGDGPITRGFDEFFGFHHARMMKSVFENDHVAEIVQPIDMLPLLTKKACENIAAHAKSEQPFFLYFALSAPHTPIVPSKEWQGKSSLGSYGDFVMETDWAVGEVLAALDKAGIANDTLVIATSDNGCSPQAGTAKLEKLGHFASAQFRGYKSDIWEGGHRIPFFVRWPGQIKAGSQCDTTICLTDFMATAADLVHVHLPDNAAEDSFSFLPELLATGHSARTSTIHQSINGFFAIREGPWKLEICPGSGGWGKPGNAAAAKQGLPPVQLYDLSHDIGEKQNVESANPSIVKRMTALLQKIVTEGRSTPGAIQKNDAPVDIRKGVPQLDD